MKRCNMSELKVCRICLTKNVKMYSYNEFMLKQYYEELMNQKVLDGLPVYFCYLCGTELYKFHKFKKKCYEGQKSLEQLLSSGVTLSSISKIDRTTKELASTIGIVTVSKRVKTYVLKHGNAIEEETHHEKENKNKDERVNTVEREENFEGDMKLDFDSHDSFGEDENKHDIEDNKAEIDISEIAEPIIDNIVLDMKSNGTKIFVEELPNKITVDSFEIEEPTKYSSKRKRRKSVTHITTNKKKSKKSKHSEKLEGTDGDSDSDILLKDIITKREERKATNAAEDRPTRKRRPPNSRQLDPKHWLKVTLTDEEAMVNFKARALEPRYVSALYKCEKCYKVFSRDDIMSRHMRLSHLQSIGSYECRFCSVIFKRKSHLTKHMKTHYCKFKCLRCGIVFPLVDTAYCHDDVHSGVMKRCEQCDLQFRHYSTYYTHLRVYHRSEHVCTLCGTSFVTQKGLQQHKKIKHVNVDSESTQEDESMYCEVCDIKFNTQQAYKEHLGQSIKHANIPAKSSTDPDEFSAIDEPPLAILKETIHRPTQRKSQETTCNVCGKVFPNYYRYKNHHRAEHKDIPIPTGSTQMCEICGATIKSCSIAIHMNIHTREKLYPCQTCGMQFHYSSSLVRHQLTHTGEKPFKCPLCEKRFTQKGSMKLHHRTFHLKEPYPQRKSRRKNADSEGETSLADLKLGTW